MMREIVMDSLALDYDKKKLLLRNSHHPLPTDETPAADLSEYLQLQYGGILPDTLSYEDVRLISEIIFNPDHPMSQPSNPFMFLRDVDGMNDLFTTKMEPQVGGGSFTTQMEPQVGGDSFTTQMEPIVMTQIEPQVRGDGFTTQMVPQVRADGFTTQRVPQLRGDRFTTQMVTQVRGDSFTTQMEPQVRSDMWQKDYTSAELLSSRIPSAPLPLEVVQINHLKHVFSI